MRAFDEGEAMSLFVNDTESAELVVERAKKTAETGVLFYPQRE